MDDFFLYELVDAVNGEFLLGDPHFPVISVSTDTRTMHKGDYYIALKGENFDGHDFLKVAIEKEAKGIIISKNNVDLGKPFPYMPAIIRVDDTLKALGDLAGYYRRKYILPVIGITGSNGKTTVKEMTASVLNLRAPALSSAGNFNNQIGLPLTLLRLNQEFKYAVVEMGTSFPGEIARLSHIASPTIGAITNIGLAHLESFGDVEAVLAEKRLLLDSLPPKGFAVINNDDENLIRIKPSLKSRVKTFGLNKEADIYTSDLKLWPGCPSFKLHIGNKTIPVELNVYGKFNVYNALAAAAICASADVDIELIKRGLERYSGYTMRMNVKTFVSGVTIVNDAYNANPASMRESISGLVQSFPDREKVVVLGDMLELGSKSKSEHQKLGGFLASQPLSQVFLYGEAMKDTFSSLTGSQTKYFKDKDELVMEIKNSLSSDMVIFFKASRAMKLEEVISKLFPEEDL